MVPLPDRNCQYLSTPVFDLIGNLSLTCSDAHGDFTRRKKRLPENAAPCRAPAPLMSRYEAQHTCAARSRRPETASAPLFQPMPAPLCLPGERTPCEREEMRCKGQRVPIRATPLSPICAQCVPLCRRGLRTSQDQLQQEGNFSKCPRSLFLSLSLVKQNSNTTF